MLVAHWPVAMGLAGVIFVLGQAPPLAEAAPVEEHKVMIWLRAFIPDKHPTLPDYFHKATNGRFVVSAPWTPAIGSLGHIQGNCFTTDSRGFDAQPSASSRVAVALELRAKGRDLTLQTSNVSTGDTHLVDCTTGVDIEPPKKANSGCVNIGPIVTSRFSRTLNVRASCGDPFFDVLGVNIAPALDFEFVLRYDGIRRTLEIKGAAGTFPSFEMYYRVDEGDVNQVMNLAPGENATAFSLFDFNLGLNGRTFKKDIDLSE